MNTFPARCIGKLDEVFSKYTGCLAVNIACIPMTVSRLAVW